MLRRNRLLSSDDLVPGIRRWR